MGKNITRSLVHGEITADAYGAEQQNHGQIRSHCALERLTGHKRTGAVQPPDAENRMSGGVEGRGAQSPLPHPIWAGMFRAFSASAASRPGMLGAPRATLRLLASGDGAG